MPAFNHMSQLNWCRSVARNQLIFFVGISSPTDLISSVTGRVRHFASDDTKYALGYGAFLWYLKSQGLLDVAEKPAERATVERWMVILRQLARSGNANCWIVVRFEELRSALQLMVPDGDFAFITKPRNVSIRQTLPKRGRIVRFVPDSRHCELWPRRCSGRPLACRVCHTGGAWYATPPFSAFWPQDPPSCAPW
jgi:hypothetical protein